MKIQVISAFLTIVCLNGYSQISLDDYYEHCRSYHPSHYSLKKNISKLDALYNTGIMKASVLLSKLICWKSWGLGFGYENHFKKPVDQEALLEEFNKYENVRKNLDQIKEYKKKASIYGLIALPGALYTMVLALVIPVKAFSGDLDWLSEPMFTWTYYPLASLALPSLMVSYSYRFGIQMKFRILPYEYNGAMIVKNRSS